MARIVSWNINGVRSLPQSLPLTISSLDADVCCFQETKITRSALDTSIAIVDGFNSYFGFCRKREGYSGVATYCKDSCAPTDAMEGLTLLYAARNDKISDDKSSADKLPQPESLYDDVFSVDELKSLDSEGRVVITRHRIAVLSSESKNDHVTDAENKYLNIINVYCPRLDPEKADRKEFKQNFYRLLQMRAEHLLESGDHVLIVGDFNCSHKRIDHCDPDADPDFDDTDSRKWMNQFIYSGPWDQPDQIPSTRFVDLFRYLHPDVREAFTCWCNYRDARVTNFGSRIDYAVADYGMIKSGLIDDVTHLTDVFGSDHCPVQVTLKNCRFVKSKSLPRLCTKFMPEFKGEQQRLHQFFEKRTVVETVEKKIDGQPMIKKVKTSETAVSSKSTRTLKDFFGSKTSTASVSHEEEIVVLTSVEKNSSDSKSSSSVEGSSTSNSQSSTSSSQSADNDSKNETVAKWTSLFKQSKNEPPVCKGHNEPCVIRVSKKPGPNKNRSFYVCGRPIGKKDDPNASCNFFRWAK